RRFAGLVVERGEALARTLTAEMGKPMAQARRELAGLGERLEFFLEHVAAVVDDTVVFRAPGLEERITWEPLGVVANVSAWNYPYFVGASAFVPALLTGNAVLYKPSELATLTGLAIGELLHEAGVPEAVFATTVGDGTVGRYVVEQPLDGVFFTGSY